MPHIHRLALSMPSRRVIMAVLMLMIYSSCRSTSSTAQDPMPSLSSTMGSSFKTTLTTEWRSSWASVRANASMPWRLKCWHEPVSQRMSTLLTVDKLFVFQSAENNSSSSLSKSLQTQLGLFHCFHFFHSDTCTSYGLPLASVKHIILMLQQVSLFSSSPPSIKLPSSATLWSSRSLIVLSFAP